MRLRATSEKGRSFGVPWTMPADVLETSGMEMESMEQHTNQDAQDTQRELETAQQREKNTFWSDVAEVLETVFISVFVVVLLFAYVIRPVTVDGESMTNTLQDGDRLLMSDLFYTPKQGDIVIIDNTHSHLYDENGNVVEGDGLKKRLIKRVIATGGQEIDIDFVTGEVKVDGEVLDEPYIRELTHEQEGGFDSYPITVPEGYYFVMGDNRNASSDSRSEHVGFIPEDSILGKAVLRISLDNFGSIYDNME